MRRVGDARGLGRFNDHVWNWPIVPSVIERAERSVTSSWETVVKERATAQRSRSHARWCGRALRYEAESKTPRHRWRGICRS
jgi:hypothetical protein